MAAAHPNGSFRGKYPIECTEPGEVSRGKSYTLPSALLTRRHSQSAAHPLLSKTERSQRKALAGILETSFQQLISRPAVRTESPDKKLELRAHTRVHQTGYRLAKHSQRGQAGRNRLSDWDARCRVSERVAHGVGGIAN